LGQEKKNMKRFGKFRDPRFALTTLQNPTWEVRTRAELIQAAQDALAHQPDAAELPFAGRPAAPGTPPPATTMPAPVAVAPLAEPQAQPPARSELQPEPPPELQPEPHPNPLIESHAIPLPRSIAKFLKTYAPKPVRKSTPKSRPRDNKPVQPADPVASANSTQNVAETLDRLITKAARPHRDEHSTVASMDRHDRKCAICHHPRRADLEEDFLNWRNADMLRKEYKLPHYRTIYRHARATGLYQRRRENLRFAAELLIEDVDQARPGPDTILRAINTCARLNDRGEWVEAVKHVVVSSGAQLTTPAPDFQPPAAPEPRQFATENAKLPQFSAPVSTSTDGANPQFLINVPAIRK